MLLFVNSTERNYRLCSKIESIDDVGNAKAESDKIETT